MYFSASGVKKDFPQKMYSHKNLSKTFSKTNTTFQLRTNKQAQNNNVHAIHATKLLDIKDNIAAYQNLHFIS